MKRILLIILLITAILSCKDSKELTIPDKDLSYKDGVVLYKGKAYTGKINVKKLNDKEQFEEGFVTLKNGHLDGITELKNEKVGTYFKFNVKDNSRLGCQLHIAEEMNGLVVELAPEY